MKILCVNGCGRFSVSEVCSITSDISKAYPQVPNKPQRHCLVKQDDFVYCIGGESTEGTVGKTNKVYQLNLSKSNLEWEKNAVDDREKDAFWCCFVRWKPGG